MEVGTVTLYLGVPRHTALTEITRAGYKYLELPPEGKESVVAVTQSNLGDPVQRAVVLVDNEGKLFFRDGTLVRIQKQAAAGQIENDRDLAFSLYAVVQELGKEGSDHCGVKANGETPYIDSPGIEAKNIVLTCGLGSGVYRSIVVRWVTNEKAKDQLHVRVFQELWR
jgi:hypothetical protein